MEDASRRDKEVVMPKWPIRVKLIAGLTLVIGMMITLMGGAIFGLHSFHCSNLILTDQLRELGASGRLLRDSVAIDALRGDGQAERDALKAQVEEARKSLRGYCEQLKDNLSRGHRADIMDELGLAKRIDFDLTELLADLDPQARPEPILPGTKAYARESPDPLGPSSQLDLPSRIDRLNRRVMDLPEILYGDFFQVIKRSKNQYESARVIVWTAALAVIAMLCALAALFNRWVLYPVRLLQRGVRRVARGSFDYRIDLATGDEMQALAEAFNDMTLRLSATYADLERQVQDRSRQLVRSERLAGVGFLAAGVAHEINNPLASIAFCSEALESRLSRLLADGDSADSKVAANYLRMIQEEAFRCKRITEKLLDFSRCGEIQRQRTDLVGLIQGVVEMVRHMGKYRGKHVAFAPREAVLAHADEQEIKQVVLNLVVNALDCMESGGTLRIDLRHAEGMAEMSFADDGCGMPPEVMENIFEPFYTKRKVGKGTGLGLSITHNIVSQHQGTITAASPGEGCGATFTVRLPVRPAGEAALAASGTRAA